jgi:hypothetical protein
MGWTGSSPSGAKNFKFSISSRLALGSHPTSYPMVSGALCPGVKRQGREADHSPPTSAEVKKSGYICPLPHTPSWFNA